MACSFSLCSPHLSSSKLSSLYSPSSSLPSPSTNPNNGNTAFKPCLLLPPSLPRLASSSPAAIRQCRTTTRTMSLPVMASSSSQGSVETSYVMIKPDGVQRGLIGEIISRFERKGFLIKGLKLFSCPKELAEEHYKDLSSKPFFPGLVQYITSGPVVCMALEGPPGLVASARKLIGVTNPLLAEPGTIRGDLGIEVGRNVVHGSDSPENGEREIALWFKEGELCEWEQTIFPWLRE